MTLALFGCLDVGCVATRSPRHPPAAEPPTPGGMRNHGARRPMLNSPQRPRTVAYQEG
jgi:hypothetical protein